MGVAYLGRTGSRASALHQQPWHPAGMASALPQGRAGWGLGSTPLALSSHLHPSFTLRRRQTTLPASSS